MAFDRDEELKAFFQRKDLLVPCHYYHPLKDACTCGRENCDSPGKHPIPRRGVFDAKVYEHAEQLGNFNVGLHCGNGLIAIDIDPRNGGHETLAELEEKHGALPKSWESVTGSRGRHIFFSCEQGQRSNMTFAKRGVEVKGYGSLVILPTSYHSSGHFYEWKEGFSPDEIELQPVPAWLLTVGKAETVVSQSSGLSELYEVCDLIECVEYCDPHCPYPEWRNIGWAIRAAGLDFWVFDDWSKRSSKYSGYHACLTVWNTFKEGYGIGLGTLVYTAKQKGWLPKPPQSLVVIPKIIVEHKPEETQKKRELTETISTLENTFDPSNCPDFPPFCVGEIAKKIYETAPIKHKQLAIASALYIVSAIGSMNYVTPIRQGSIALYMLSVAGAAVGKEFYRSACEKIVKRFTPKKVMSEPLSSQALRFLWLDCNARSFVTDEVLKWLSKIYDSRNQSGSMICSDVLTVWSLSSDTLQGYSTKKKDDKTPDVQNPCLCIFGCGTERKFEELCRNEEFVYDGFLSRSDVVFARTRKENEKTVSSPRIQSKGLSLKNDSCFRLKAIAKEPTEGNFVEFDSKNPKKVEGGLRKKYRYLLKQEIDWESEEVGEEWDRIFFLCQERAENDTEDVSNSLWNRAAEKTLRVASICSILENATKPSITKAMLAWAWEWEQYVIDGMCASIGINKGNHVEIIRARILRAMQVKLGKVKGSVIAFGQLQSFDRKIGSVSNRDTQDALDWLVRVGKIERHQREYRGRQVEVFSLAD